MLLLLDMRLHNTFSLPSGWRRRNLPPPVNRQHTNKTAPIYTNQPTNLQQIVNILNANESTLPSSLKCYCWVVRLVGGPSGNVEENPDLNGSVNLGHPHKPHTHTHRVRSGRRASTPRTDDGRSGPGFPEEKLHSDRGLDLLCSVTDICNYGDRRVGGIWYGDL